MSGRDGREVEGGGLENRSPKGPGVRIPLSPDKKTLRGFLSVVEAHLKVRDSALRLAWRLNF